MKIVYLLTGMWLCVQDATCPKNIFLDSFTEIRASTVADGTKTTSGIALINFSWGTVSPARLATIAAGGVTSPVMMVESSNLLRFSLFCINSMNSLFLFESSAELHSLK